MLGWRWNNCLFWQSPSIPVSALLPQSKTHFIYLFLLSTRMTSGRHIIKLPTRWSIFNSIQIFFLQLNLVSIIFLPNSLFSKYSLNNTAHHFLFVSSIPSISSTFYTLHANMKAWSNEELISVIFIEALLTKLSNIHIYAKYLWMSDNFLNPVIFQCVTSLPLTNTQPW